MKIQIDTQEKIVKILEPTRLSDLTEMLRKILGDEYEEYTLWFTSEYNPWVNPIIIQPWIQDPYPCNPWTTWTTSHASIGDSTYNIELQEFNSNN